MIRVVLIDDHALVREGLRRILEQAGDIDVVGVADSGHGALGLYTAHLPDVTVMDVSMPDISGPEATRRIRAVHPDAVVVMLTASTAQNDVLESLDAGATGYLVKDADPTSLVSAVREAANGQAPLDARAGRVVLDVRNDRSAERPTLTARELDVLRLIERGMSNKAVARELQIAEKTVKAHLTRVFAALGVEGRTQAALWARDHLPV